MSSRALSRVSVEEYLEREQAAPDRHEFLNGEVFLMAGGTAAHADISSNILVEIGLQLRKSANGCRIRGSDMRIRTSPAGLYTYADAVVSCAGEQIEGNTLLTPIAIVEVLSPSTESYDRGKKFEEYRRIDTFQEYLVVAQDRIYLEHHQRSAQFWAMREYHQAEDTISLPSIGVRLPVREIYAGVLPLN